MSHTLCAGYILHAGLAYQSDFLAHLKVHYSKDFPTTLLENYWGVFWDLEPSQNMLLESAKKYHGPKHFTEKNGKMSHVLWQGTAQNLTRERLLHGI